MKRAVTRIASPISQTHTVEISRRVAGTAPGYLVVAERGRPRENGKEAGRWSGSPADGPRAVRPGAGPLKVVHVTLRFDAPGGVETTVRELARRQRALGDDVEVYASDLFDEAGWVRRQDYRPTVDEVPVRRFGIVKRPFPRLTLPMMVGLVDALRESGADVVHAHSHRYGHVLQAAAVARRRSIPLVVSTHYHPADRRETPLKRGLLRLEDFAFGAAAYRTADALVVESRREAELVREFAPAGRIHVIPPGIDVAEWDAGAGDTSLVGDLPSRYLLFVGRIASNKGLPFLLEAYSRLDHGSAPELVLMGPDWGETARLGSLATRLGVRERTHFLGAVADRARYRAIVRRAAALVLPSEWEAFGLVLLEAMAAGTPVVATAVGAVPEVVEDGRAGRLVPYGDVGALAIALRAVDDDREETARRVAVGRARARSLDWSISVERQRALYRAVAPGAA